MAYSVLRNPMFEAPIVADQPPPANAQVTLHGPIRGRDDGGLIFKQIRIHRYAYARYSPCSKVLYPGWPTRSEAQWSPSTIDEPNDSPHISYFAPTFRSAEIALSFTSLCEIHGSWLSLSGSEMKARPVTATDRKGEMIVTPTRVCRLRTFETIPFWMWDTISYEIPSTGQRVA
ncbi:hypothetical protein BO78DRAFT_383263 [Aspergillus sclerotiicarbonarius CBS 121057]|uniref:Uncharacterized protein n=1 Tax=Aspergillus sclerotiicarbonarius (strain CBS 121057 / IBT 28362) TaxID=1448318 RepID=A0A319ESM7_ASPSB|nr:hypothetical protein BO78DRAFT_383263 [Aspergillus sclerotiicarbonarius CBS 121057]